MKEKNYHQQFMERALREARAGEGLTGTNPLVGCCLVKDGSIIGAEAHRKFGGDHAEIRLLDKFAQSEPGADLYCTLEPCTHEGKTPPCLPAIIKSDPRRVVLAHTDPNHGGGGRAIQQLLEEGIEVIFPVRRRQYRSLNRAYFYRLETGLPWVEIKLALSADGYIATTTHDSQWLNSPPSRTEVHRQRARADAVMVGGNTVRRDDPRLTVRHVETSVQPRPIIVTAHPEGIPLQVQLLNERAEETIIVIPADTSRDWCREVGRRGVTVVKVEPEEKKFSWPVVLEKLVEENIGRIFIEGGGGLAGSLLADGVVNELHLFNCGKVLGDGIRSFQLPENVSRVNEAPEASLVESRQFSDDVYIRRLFRRPLQDAGLLDVYKNLTGRPN